MQAILTRYHGPTNTKPSRITASCRAGRLTMTYNHAATDASREAAEALCVKLGWNCKLIGGTLPSGDDVFVIVPDTFK